MQSMYHIFSKLFRWGLILGALGLLPKATLYLAHAALDSHHVGMISLGRLNRQLIAGGQSNHKGHRHSQAIEHVQR